MNEMPESELEKALLKLDYKLKTMEERRDLVDQIVQQTPQEELTHHYLEILGDYIMGALSKEEKKEKLYLTENRLVTINKRETSLEGLAEKFENGEDGIYNIMTNDKNILFKPKVTITEDDVREVPGLAELREAMAEVEREGKVATGRRKYLLKKQLIEMRQDQYILRTAYRQPMYVAPTNHINMSTKIDLHETRFIDEYGEPQSDGLVTLFNPSHISALLCHYKDLKDELEQNYLSDFFYLLQDLDALVNEALEDKPVYKLIVKMKISGQSSIKIQEQIYNDYGVSYSTEYISQLWRKKIPEMCADKEKEKFLVQYYKTEARGTWKRCSCCGKFKLANYRFFSKNKTSKDQYYSICKECRKKKRRES